MKTERTPIEYFGKSGNAGIWLKREDRIPTALGGNKVRILEEVFSEMTERDCDALVTYGSASSNLNRAAVLMAKEREIPVTVIIKQEYGTEGARSAPGRNEQIVRESGARILETAPDRVRETVREALEQFRNEGKNPYYVYGDETGKGGEAVLLRAYRKVFAEILQQEKELGIRFETIAVPVGTGATLAGLVSACDESHRILGISVSRTGQAIRERLEQDLAAAGMPGSIAEQLSRAEITDRYLCGGYGHSDDAQRKLIRSVYAEKSVPLDPVYTGKAFYGLTEEIKEGRTGKTVLFLHTGGYPLFLDFLSVRDGSCGHISAR